MCLFYSIRPNVVVIARYNREIPKAYFDNSYVNWSSRVG